MSSDEEEDDGGVGRKLSQLSKGSIGTHEDNGYYTDNFFIHSLSEKSHFTQLYLETEDEFIDCSKSVLFGKSNQSHTRAMSVIIQQVRSAPGLDLYTDPKVMIEKIIANEEQDVIAEYIDTDSSQISYEDVSISLALNHLRLLLTWQKQT